MAGPEVKVSGEGSQGLTNHNSLMVILFALVPVGQRILQEIEY